MTFHKINPLTARELEILTLLSQEYSTKEIAQELFLSRSTIESHRRNLLLKMKAKNTAGLIRRSFETGIFKVENNKEIYDNQNTSRTHLRYMQG